MGIVAGYSNNSSTTDRMRKQMKNKTFVLPQIALATLMLVNLACGASSSGVKVGEATTSRNPTSAPPETETYKVGDVIQVRDSTIVLNSADFRAGSLKANFTIENKGAKDLNISSILSFSARDSEGIKLALEMFDCGPAGGGLDGKVLPGDKLKGDICWSGATTNTVKIYYEASLFGSGAVVWEITK